MNKNEEISNITDDTIMSGGIAHAIGIDHHVKRYPYKGLIQYKTIVGIRTAYIIELIDIKITEEAGDIYGPIKIFFKDKYGIPDEKWIGAYDTFLEYGNRRYETTADFYELQQKHERKKIENMLEKL